MKSDLAIKAEGIGKQYLIGAKQRSYQTLRESVMNVANAWRHRKQRRAENLVWALKDVSFEVKHGEVVGIVGCNGAGKSTLLKVLSRITDPTTGYVDLRGRVGSLLEVGTGFHPELTGRENIFLNGAILGMPRSTVIRRFDEMVDFAGVDKFIDTPVKRYSSGMYLRLAFAVAAHLEPEILLVDEVLAVGDAQFQNKCIGKMESVAQEGRTVLFVSHNMAAVRSLCTRGIFLRQGELTAEGAVQDIIQEYYTDLGMLGNQDDSDDGAISRTVLGRISLDDGADNSIDQSQPFQLSTTINLERPISSFRLMCLFNDMHNKQIIGVEMTSNELGFDDIRAGRHRVAVKFPALWLNPGMYSAYFKLFISGGEMEAWKHQSDTFPLDVYGSSSSVPALIHPETSWSFNPNEPVTQTNFDESLRAGR